VWNGGRRGIVVDIETTTDISSIRGTIRDGFGNLDTVIDIERVVGTRFNVVFVGSRTDNVFAAAEGVDSYDGQAGFDAINFGWSFGNTPPGEAVVDLARATGQIQNDGFGNAETAISIKMIWGADGNDRFSGNALDNFIEGVKGSDVMTGRAGIDTFYWDGDYDLDAVDRVTDFTATGLAADRLAFDVASDVGMTGTAVVVNGTAATQAVGTFFYNAANDRLFWDRDGAAVAPAVAVVVLTNVASLSAANFDLFV